MQRSGLGFATSRFFRGRSQFDDLIFRGLADDVFEGHWKKRGWREKGGGGLRNFKCHQTENLNHSLATLAPCFLKSLLSVGIKLLHIQHHVANRCLLCPDKPVIIQIFGYFQIKPNQSVFFEQKTEEFSCQMSHKLQS